MRRMWLLLLVVGCSRSNFNAAEAQFVDSLNYLELIHHLLRDIDSPKTLKEAEQKIPPLLDNFDRLGESKEPISYQLHRRLYDRYHVRFDEARNGIAAELQRLRWHHDSPMLLKVEAWLAKMTVNK